MRLKPGASIEGVSWRMFHVALVAEAIYRKRGAELVITSGSDGRHMRRSKHYARNNASRMGEALDLRRWGVDAEAVAAELREQLGGEYDAVVEKDHIHVEHDP